MTVLDRLPTMGRRRARPLDRMIDRLGRAPQELRHQTGRLGDGIGARASDLGERGDRLPDQLRRLPDRLPRRRRPASTMPAWGTAAAVGVAVMTATTLLFVTLGRRMRRADLLGSGARDVTNRIQGAVAGARGSGRGPVDDAVLEERVRSALGRAGGHTGGLSVEVRDGVVTLSGSVLAEELERIRTAVHGARGIQQVNERLDVREEPGDLPALQGPAAPPTWERRRGWPPAYRLAAVAGGWGISAAAITAAARLRQPIVAVPGVLAGVALAARGATNRAPWQLLGIGGERRGIDVEKAIEVDAPVEAAFTLWDRFEEFPRFMEHVREVRTEADGVSRWTVAGPAGVPITFRAEVTERVANERIAWRSLDGEPMRHAGSVQFEPRPANRCRVTVRLSYNPPAGVLAHGLSRLLGVDPKRALDDDLLRFQSLLVHGKTTADGRQTTVGEVAPSAAAWSPTAAGAGISPAGAASDAVAALRPGGPAGPDTARGSAGEASAGPDAGEATLDAGGGEPGSPAPGEERERPGI